MFQNGRLAVLCSSHKARWLLRISGNSDTGLTPKGAAAAGKQVRAGSGRAGQGYS